MKFSFGKKSSKPYIIGQIDGVRQELLIYPSVIQHMNCYRQFHRNSKEAGGQLFGAIEMNRICVTGAIGPYKGDERSRNEYRSNQVAAQRAINKKSEEGCLYLGEWHTHAEDYPDASHCDADAMHRLIVNSRLNSSGLLMIIMGQYQGVSGLGAWVVSDKGICKWNLKEATRQFIV